MTSEVALMNRSAVALAADSAVTVTYWDHVASEQKQRYFKRANKIFNLVSGAPVGLMTYGSGSLQGMPWEVLIKAYRDGRKHSAQLATLPEYAADLFKFLSGKRDIFSKEDQEEALYTNISEVATMLGMTIAHSDEVKAENDAARKLSKMEAALEQAE